ncbi:hypothetical protein [Mycoplasma phocoeninasale]|nr:hypothetical protein [Mycoplasma phocoeninasale]
MIGYIAHTDTSLPLIAAACDKGNFTNPKQFDDNNMIIYSQVI